MKDVGSCLLCVLAGLAFCAYLAGIICLGLSLLWLAFDVAKNAVLAYVGFGLVLGGRLIFKPLYKIVMEVG